MRKILTYFTFSEIVLWSISILLITVPFFIFDRENYLTYGASIVGVSALLLNAKGNPIGQVTIIIFSIMYGYISFKNQYYGEMLTYVGMSGPMAFFSLISWLKNPYNGNKSEVRIHRIRWYEILTISVLTVIVTIIFYFLLKYCDTANLLVSTFSVTTTFFAVCLTMRRSPYFALAYCLNDVVLIILWGLAVPEDVSNISVLMCFVAFFINDIYGYINWRRMQIRQYGS